MRAQDGSENLPEWSEAATAVPLDALIPAAGLLPAPAPEGQPADLPPANQMPDIAPLHAPSDGAEEPELPDDVPGLVAPKEAPVQLNSAGQPMRPDPLAQLGDAVYWHKSPRQARTMAQEKGRPMLLVFGSFKKSPASDALNNDVFCDRRFTEYAGKNLVLSLLNVQNTASSNLGSDGSLADQRKLAIKSYMTFLRIRSLPTMVLFDSEGHEVARFVGYNFRKELRVNSREKTMQQIMLAGNKLVADRAAQDRRRKLLTETQDYRYWTSRTGSTLFAKADGLIKIAAPTAEDELGSEPAAVLMDERGVNRYVPLRTLVMVDAEVVKRRFRPKPPATAEVAATPPADGASTTATHRDPASGNGTQ
jgi:hypothetical protein